jgi:hypothetical protein
MARLEVEMNVDQVLGYTFEGWCRMAGFYQSATHETLPMSPKLDDGTKVMDFWHNRRTDSPNAQPMLIDLRTLQPMDYATDPELRFWTAKFFYNVSVEVSGRSIFVEV